MAAYTKATTALSTAQSIAASTPANSTNTLSCQTYMSFGVAGTATNGTGIALTLLIQLQASADNSNWYVIDQTGTLGGNGTVSNFSFSLIPDGWQYLRLAYSGNTGAAVVVSAVVAYATLFA